MIWRKILQLCLHKRIGADTAFDRNLPLEREKYGILCKVQEKGVICGEEGNPKNCAPVFSQNQSSRLNEKEKAIVKSSIEK